MLNIKKNFDKLLIAFLLILFIGFGLINKGSVKKSSVNLQENSDKYNFPVNKDFEGKQEVSEKNLENKDSKIYVDISGQVKKPGVYEMKSGDRLFSLIDKAGGLLEDADRMRINLSVLLSDQAKIHIYKIGEEGASENSSRTESNKKLDLNKASLDELMTIPGIGESKAKRIIDYRDNKRFSKIEDIMNVSGFGQKSFDRIKEYIMVE